ncbi:MAG: hypothetical protein GXO50_05100 [Chlorobi bacterium]|nr:hypothetical protein [Chlorobiota bacterium]
MKQSELQALISLLDDKDPVIYEAVKNRLLQAGESVIPDLQISSLYLNNDLFTERTDEIISLLRFRKLDKDFKQWIKNDGRLLYGAFLTAKYQYPDLVYEDIESKLNKIVSDLRSEIHLYLTGLQQIRKINRILYEVHRFSPDFSDVVNPDTSFLNKVLESKKGNDVLIAVVYIYVARKLGLPVYGVDFPRNFLLMFKDERTGEALFYINPYNNGTVVTENDISVFLKKHKIKIRKSYFEPCSDIQIIKRLLKILMNSYIQKNNRRKTEDIRHILNLF